MEGEVTHCLATRHQGDFCMEKVVAWLFQVLQPILKRPSLDIMLSAMDEWLEPMEGESYSALLSVSKGIPAWCMSMHSFMELRPFLKRPSQV